MVDADVLELRFIPFEELIRLRKSYIQLLLIVTVFAEPPEYMAFMGRFASAAFVILLLSIVFPVLADVALRKITPPPASVVEPLIVQYLMLLSLAPLYNRMVLVPLFPELLVFEITRSFELPEAFTLPSIVTLSAPFRSISGAARFPLIVFPVTVGYILTEV